MAGQREVNHSPKQQPPPGGRKPAPVHSQPTGRPPRPSNRGPNGAFSPSLPTASPHSAGSTGRARASRQRRRDIGSQPYEAWLLSKKDRGRDSTASLGERAKIHRRPPGPIVSPGSQAPARAVGGTPPGMRYCRCCRHNHSVEDFVVTASATADGGVAGAGGKRYYSACGVHCRAVHPWRMSWEHKTDTAAHKLGISNASSGSTRRPKSGRKGEGEGEEWESGPRSRAMAGSVEAPPLHQAHATAARQGRRTVWPAVTGSSSTSPCSSPSTDTVQQARHHDVGTDRHAGAAVKAGDSCTGGFGRGRMQNPSIREFWGARTGEQAHSTTCRMHRPSQTLTINQAVGTTATAAQGSIDAMTGLEPAAARLLERGGRAPAPVARIPKNAAPTQQSTPPRELEATAMAAVRGEALGLAEGRARCEAMTAMAREADWRSRTEDERQAALTLSQMRQRVNAPEEDLQAALSLLQMGRSRVSSGVGGA